MMNILDNKITYKQLWETGKSEEIYFWNHFLTTQGNIWPQDFLDRQNPDQPLQKYIIKHLSALPGGTVSILDVGAGPLTKLGKIWPDHQVKITAVDPLADEYNRILDECGLVPLVKTEPLEAEDLLSRFAWDHFDLVHCCNALDHSYNPLAGVLQMLAVVKPNSYVVLFHIINEAENENYEGMHQWNLCSENQEFIIWNRQTKINVNTLLKDIAQIKMFPHDNWLMIFLKKTEKSENNNSNSELEKLLNMSPVA